MIWTAIWKWSAAALLAGNSLDSVSSMHRKEANPILAQNGRFTMGSVAIKSAVIGGVLLLQRKHPGKAYAVVNFTSAGVFTGIAVRNWRNK